MRVKRLAVLALLMAVTRSVPADELKPFPEESPASEPSSTDSEPQPEEWKPALLVTLSTSPDAAFVVGKRQILTPTVSQKKVEFPDSNEESQEQTVSVVTFRKQIVDAILPVGIYALCDSATVSASPSDNGSTLYTFDARGRVTFIYGRMRFRCQSAIFDGKNLSMKGVEIQYGNKVMSSENVSFPIAIVGVQSKSFGQPETAFQPPAFDGLAQPMPDPGFREADDWNPQRPKDKGDQMRDLLDRGRSRDFKKTTTSDFESRSDLGQ